jgi:hypothetical protein
MQPETAPLISPPLLVYIGLGIVMARILLEGKGRRGLGVLGLLVKAATIIMLWPLVLFAEKLMDWLRSSHEGER